MLRNFRSVFKSNQTPMTIIMLVVLVGMVAYLAPSNSRGEAPDNVMARVYGREILRRDVEKSLAEMVRRMGRQQNMESMMPYLQSRALQELTQKKLMEEMAERRGIVVTDEETRAALEARLRQNPPLLDSNGQLKPLAEINDLFHQNGLSLIQWEREIREGLLYTKLMKQAAALVPVDEAWVAQADRIQNEKISYEFASYPPQTAAVADPGDNVLAPFMKASGARFQVGLRRVVQFVALDKAAMGDAIKVDDAALQAAYAAKKAQYTELQASHILFKASNDAQYAEATAKAKELRAKLVAGQDFNKTAEAVSEDPTAKGNGGRLPKFSTGAMVKPFEDAAMAMKIGDISQPVRTQFGIHLIKLEARHEKTFEEVKNELSDQLTRERFNSKAKEKLEQLRKRVGERGDLAPGARAMNLKMKTSAPFLNESDVVIEGLPNPGIIPSAAFRMKVGEVSKVQMVGDAYIVFRVLEERSATIPPLAEVRAKVLAAWKLEEARKAALKKAQAALQSGNFADLAAPSTKENATIQSLGEIGQHPAIQKALLDTPVGSLTPALWTPDGQIWIARIKARTPAEALTFEKRQKLVEEIQNTTSEKLLTAELKDMETKGKQRPGFSSLWGRLSGIWVNTDLAKKTGVDIPDSDQD